MERASSTQTHEPTDERGAVVELTIVMPCLDEVQTIGTCIEKALSSFRRLGVRGEVVVADNGSTDGSIEVAESLGARVIRVAQRGYGAALMAGCREAHGTFILMGDADDSYDFSDIGGFIEHLREGYDLVMGTRLRGTILPGAMPWKNRYIGNPFLTGMLRWLFKAQISDAHCGLRGFSKRAFERMGLRSRGMEFASEMVIRAAKLKMRITEVPITFHPDGRDRAPHLRPWRDGWRHMKLMLLFSPSALFLVPGVTLFVLGTLLMVTQTLGPPGRPVVLLGLRLDFHWAVAGSLLALLGYQIIAIHFFARVYSVTHRIREADPLLTRAFRVLRLGRVLAFASLVTLAGFIMDGIVVVRWLDDEFGRLLPQDTRLFVFGSTMIALGIQTIFNAFFMSILGDSYRSEE